MMMMGKRVGGGQRAYVAKVAHEVSGDDVVGGWWYLVWPPVPSSSVDDRDAASSQKVVAIWGICNVLEFQHRSKIDSFGRSSGGRK